jgi:hypothetical protein
MVKILKKKIQKILSMVMYMYKKYHYFKDYLCHIIYDHGDLTMERPPMAQ